jgi:hypothetical protein
MVDREGARAADRRWGFAPAGWRNLAVQGVRARWCDVDTDEVVEVEVRTDRAGTTAVLVGTWPTHDDQGALLTDERTERRVRARLEGEMLSLEVDGRRRTWQVTCSAAGLTVAGPQGSATWVQEPRFADHDVTAGARRRPARRRGAGWTERGLSAPPQVMAATKPQTGNDCKTLG